MTMFGAINTAGNGMSVYRTWLDAVSDNISNINDAVPGDQAAFQERFINATEATDGTNGGIGNGPVVTGVQYGDPTGRLVHDPTNPLADANGDVRYPDIDLGQQMTYMIMAQRGYEANIAVVDRAKEAYQAALELGK